MKEKEYKKFEDLVFKKHQLSMFETHAIMMFENGYGVSVITGYCAHANEKNQYEVAALDANGSVYYDDNEFQDTVGYCTQDDVTRLMKVIQDFEPIKTQNND